jgi:protein tyrosine phosphatase (PTP) superfamily phosphohydrolase (DUF442 family)
MLPKLARSLRQGQSENGEPIMPDPEDIACWQRLDHRTTTSGRLTAGDIDALAALGVAHVINLALADSPGILTDESARLAALGIAYTHVPVPFAAPDDGHFAAFRAAYEAEPRPIHVHCVMNWRVSAFFYRYNRDVRDMPEPKARALMERQWSPESVDHPDGPAWADFIARRS